MGVLRSKAMIIAVEEEGSFGSGPTRDHVATGTIPSGFAANYSVVLGINSGITNGLVSEPSIRAYIDGGTVSGAVDAGDTLLVYGTDYTVVTNSTNTTVTFLTTGTTLTGGENVVIEYGIFDDSDVIIFDTGTFIDSSIEEITPNTANGELVGCESLAGQESSSGTVTFDLSMITTQPVASAGMLTNHKLIKNALGVYVAKGATVNKTAGTITPVTTGTGTHDLYRFIKTADGAVQTSLAARQYLGGSSTATEDFYGIMAENISMNMNTADLVKFDIPIQGIDINLISETYGDPDVLTGPSCSGGSFVGKRGIFKFYGNNVDVTGVTFSPSNTLRDSNAITSSGIYRKTVTEKMFEGSFDIEIEDTTMLANFKNNVSGTLYFELINSAGDEIIIYFPNIKITQVGRSDDGGVIVQNTTFKASMNATRDVFYMATKKA